MSVDSNKSARAKSDRKTIVRRLLEVLISAVLLWLFFIFAGRTLCKIAIRQIAELTNTKIESKSVDFNFNGSVFIRELVIKPNGGQKYDDAILKAKMVYARFGIGSLLLLRPRLKEIRVKDFVFNAIHDLDTGRWNIAALKIGAPKGTSRKMPLVNLKGGTLRYSKISNGQAKVAASVPLDARFGFDEETRDGYRFKITTAEWARFAKSTLTGFWKPGRIAITGGISSTNVPAFERVWTINVLAAELTYDRSSNYSLKLKVRDLISTYNPAGDAFAFDRPKFLEKSGLFTALQRFFNKYTPSGQVDIDFEALGNLQQLAESTVSGKVYCKDVSICDRKFPYAIEHLVGQIDFTERSVSLNNLCGWHKDTKLFINGWTKDFGPNRRYEIRITSDNMALDKDLYDALNKKEKELWSALSPQGLAAIDYNISRQSETDQKKTLAVELLDVEAAYHNFPYPLKSLTGRLLFDYDSITISDLLSQLNGRKITLNGKVTACRTARPIYDISIKANNIPLDSTLMAALPAKQKRFCDHFDVTGLADVQIKVFTPEQGPEPASFIADVFFKDASLKPSQSLLVVSDISGKAVFTPDLITIESFVGKYGRGSVSLAGRIWPGKQAEQIRYHLSLNTKQGELNEDLFALLPASLRKVVSELQPEGTMSYRLDVDKGGSDDSAGYKVTVDCLGGSISFEPFPYPLKDVTGSIVVTRDAITLEDITATAAGNVQIAPNSSTIEINGKVALSDNAFSGASFSLSANDIFLDERLGAALPESIRDYYSKLSPTGRFDLNFENIKISNAEEGGRYVDFAGTVKFKDCSFNVSRPVTELNALLKTKGLYKTGDGFSDAQAALVAEGLRIKGKSLTGLKADIHYDHGRRSWSTDNLIADSYEGRLAGRFELRQPADKTLEYLLQIGFDDVDLKQFLSDTESSRTSRKAHTTGKMCGSLSVTGRVGDNRSRIGKCELQITDMQVGKLSPLTKLLQLKLTESEHYAFDQMLVDSYVKRDKLIFEQVDLSGKEMAFNGSGWMDLRNQNIDMVLTGRGHHRLANATPSVWQSLTEGLGRAVVRMEITGNFYDPQVTTITLPVFKDALGILGTKPAETK